MDMLWNTNLNLMQILSKKYGYKAEIEHYNKEHEKTIYNREDLMDYLNIPPAQRRKVNQLITIVKSLKKTYGCLLYTSKIIHLRFLKANTIQ